MARGGVWLPTIAQDYVCRDTAARLDVSVVSKHPPSSDHESEQFAIGNRADLWVQVAGGCVLCLRAGVAGVPFGPRIV